MALKVSSLDKEQHGGAGVDCDGKCENCEFEKSCRGAWWDVVREKLERRYRLRALRISLRQLEYVDPTQYHAIQVCYVDPLDVDWYHLDELWFRVAEDGIRWMADEIPGEITPYGEKRIPRNVRIHELREQGYSYRRIAVIVGCSYREISVCLHGQEVRPESTVSAVG